MADYRIPDDQLSDDRIPDDRHSDVWTAPPPVDTDGTMIGTERQIYLDYLAHHRQTLLNICAGLTAQQLALRPVPTSSLSLLGLLRHLAKVERAWFRVRLAGERVELPYPLGVDADFDDGTAADAPAALSQLQAEWVACDDAVAGLPLDHEVDAGKGPFSLRWAYVHLIEEYARHNGHADLLRQSIDGVAGR